MSLFRDLTPSISTDLLLRHAIGGRQSLGYTYKTEFSKEYTFKKVDTCFLTNKKFIRYNTHKFCNSLIWDIDNFDEIGYKPSLLQMHDHFYTITGLEPTWTTQTDNGYHIAIVLKFGQFLTHKNGRETQTSINLKKLKSTITEMIAGDAAGSNRIIGIWRNPINHKSIITDKLYETEEIMEAVGIESKPHRQRFYQGKLNLSTSFKLGKNTKIKKWLTDGYTIGNRNNFIFSFGYKIKFEHRQISNTSLLSIMQNENIKHGSGLNRKEVENIFKSITKMAQTMYTGGNSRRGKLSDEMWTRNIHGIKNRRIFAALHTSKERSLKTLQQILTAGVDLLDQANPLNHKTIAEAIGKHPRTIRRHDQKTGIITMIFIAWFKALAKRAASQEDLKKIDIRPIVTQVIKREVKIRLERIFASWIERWELILQPPPIQIA